MKLTDFSQLKSLMFKEAEPVSKPAPSVGVSKDQEVIDFFTKGKRGVTTSMNDRVPAAMTDRVPAAEADPVVLAAEIADLKVKLAAALRERDENRDRAEQADMVAGSVQKKVAEQERELARLRGDNARLKGEAERSAKTSEVSSGAEAGQRVEAEAARPLNGVLATSAGFVEAFPGELRELVIAVLEDSLDVARNGKRERRIAALEAVLKVNPPSGELARRKAELKQVLKDSGYVNDPSALEKLGFRLVSGKKHWKLEYADVRLPLSKTPSDRRANLNSANDMANRCF